MIPGWNASARASRARRRLQAGLIISQHGCDAHALDPLSHIHCSMRIYREMPRSSTGWRISYAGGRWLAVAAAATIIWRVVPRAWALVWLEMTDHPLLGEIDGRGFAATLPAPGDCAGKR